LAGLTGVFINDMYVDYELPERCIEICKDKVLIHMPEDIACQLEALSRVRALVNAKEVLLVAVINKCETLDVTMQELFHQLQQDNPQLNFDVVNFGLEKSE